MQKLPKWKIFLSIVCTVLALVCALPNFTQVNYETLPSRTINLGLDLRGGAHLLLDVDFDSYLHDVMEHLTDQIRKDLREEKIVSMNDLFISIN